MKQKRRPKQNFNINYQQIRSSNLKVKQQNLLMTILEFHKENCKFEYKNLLNSSLANSLDISVPTLIKHRELLKLEKLFKLKEIRVGKSFVIQYRPEFPKLLRLKFITPIEQSEYKPVFKQKPKQHFEVGHVFTMSDIPKLVENKLYEVKQYRLDSTGNRKGNGILNKGSGKNVVNMIRISNNSKEHEYVFVKIQ